MSVLFVTDQIIRIMLTNGAPSRLVLKRYTRYLLGIKLLWFSSNSNSLISYAVLKENQTPNIYFV